MRECRHCEVSRSAAKLPAPAATVPSALKTEKLDDGFVMKQSAMRPDDGGGRGGEGGGH